MLTCELEEEEEEEEADVRMTRELRESKYWSAARGFAGGPKVQTVLAGISR